ncbi:carbamoyltransferase HypF [Jatrophihabitans telluris]|uniref:Carbamoyltransferase n=1 Tax=Jatrophihabitans telluris TaxID=2038343 RepID=A0ABY4R364_9ACTN|nr:carbamoyltransferase HypF [Jatrophihabitans telluris]UQX89469.1 carbamoyltransferase HypF [Jatrophihabitans telluris]
MLTERDRHRRRVVVHGLVQGVGFRPFVYALAREAGLSGQVHNCSDGVEVEVEGPTPALEAFVASLRPRAPSMARIVAIDVTEVEVRGGSEFEIGLSDSAPPGRTLVSPDIATCPDCLSELADPASRYYRHPFVSCTNCGPRFTVVRGLPYDRPNTTMADLPLCAPCSAAYAEPGDRRFHAQTIACPQCGPVLSLVRPGLADVTGQDAVAESRRLLSAGAVLAVKGIGGYHLACDASAEQAVATLRKRKGRGDKPFAVMVADLPTARQIVHVSPAEAGLLADHRRPVVLLDQRRQRPPGAPAVSASVAPGRTELGVMLAYTGLHHLLFGLSGDQPSPRVLVMTSGNLAGEPIVIDDGAARERLVALVDAWLVHDRPIRIPCDDSVVRMAGGIELPVRRSRGFAPMPISLPFAVRPALAVGGDLKNTFCLAEGHYAWMSAHVGDMDDWATLQAFDAAVEQLATITSVRPELVVADRHPGYRSTAWARRATRSPSPLHRGPAEQGAHPQLGLVQHHHAHVAAAMAENGHPPGEPVVGFAFDGTGYGNDGAVWGGEVLVADYDAFERIGHLRYVRLPGGDAAVRNPCRMALSHLHSARIGWDPAIPSVAACRPEELTVLERQVRTGLGCSPTSSMGRLFDAVSSLAGVCHRIDYEAEAAMLFEAAARPAIDGCPDPYAFSVVSGVEGLLADPAPVLAAVVADVLAGVGAARIAARFHLAVAGLVLDLAEHVRARRGLDTVALSGGVFLNAALTTLCVKGLQQRGFRVLRHRLVPPSDAGIALGQIAVAARRDSSSHGITTTEGRADD